MGRNDEPDPTLELQTAIQRAKIASMLAELRSFPSRIVAPAATDLTESEDLRRYVADLRAELVLERARRKRLEHFVGNEVMLYVGLLAIMLLFLLVLIWMELI